MFRVASVEEILGWELDERVLLLKAELALLGAFPDAQSDEAVKERAQALQGCEGVVATTVDDYVLSVFGEHPYARWRDDFEASAGRLAQPRREVLMALLAVEEGALEFETLGTVLAQRRLDHIYDLAKVEMTGHLATSFFGSLVEELSAVQVSTTARRIAGGLAGVTGFIGGAHGMVAAGSWADKGTSYILGQMGKADDFTVSCATLVFAAMAAMENTDGSEVVTAIFAYLYKTSFEVCHQFSDAKRRGLASGQLAKAGRVIVEAAEFVFDALGESAKLKCPVRVHEFVGLGLAPAEKLAKMQGREVRTYDQNGSGRWRTNKDSWVVTKVEVAEALGPLTLEARKWSD